jgi:activator of HSP90 ATPase
MAFEFTVSDVIPASPKAVYAAWLNGKSHAAMTRGGPATGSTKVGGRFTAWDGYIAGKNLKLEPDRRIVQSWRTTEFKDGDPDSEIDVQLEAVVKGTKITLRHSNVPEGHNGYKSGWQTCYFDPMKTYFLAAANKK